MGTKSNACLTLGRDAFHRVPRIVVPFSQGNSGQDLRASVERVPTIRSSGPQFLAAWTLIEMIAAVAVLAILAALLLPAFIKEMDKSTADQERATLQSFADAFQQYVLTTRTVPNENGWVGAITSRLGVGNNHVLYNTHQPLHQVFNSRVFLIEPAALGLGAAGNGLPYAQGDYVVMNRQFKRAC